MSDPVHLAILRSGSVAWNSWRLSNVEIVPDLSDSKLNDLDLRGYNLRGVDFTNVRAINCDFSDVNFRNSTLTNADFSQSKISQVEEWPKGFLGFSSQKSSEELLSASPIELAWQDGKISVIASSPIVSVEDQSTFQSILEAQAAEVKKIIEEVERYNVDRGLRDGLGRYQKLCVGQPDKINVIHLDTIYRTIYQSVKINSDALGTFSASHLEALFQNHRILRALDQKWIRYSAVGSEAEQRAIRGEELEAFIAAITNPPASEVIEDDAVDQIILEINQPEEISDEVNNGRNWKQFSVRGMCIKILELLTDPPKLVKNIDAILILKDKISKLFSLIS